MLINSSNKVINSNECGDQTFFGFSTVISEFRSVILSSNINNVSLEVLTNKKSTIFNVVEYYATK